MTKLTNWIKQETPIPLAIAFLFAVWVAFISALGAFAAFVYFVFTKAYDLTTQLLNWVF
jgi:hypothetical protein